MSDGTTDDLGEQIRDLVAEEYGGVSKGAEDFGVITVVVEEHADDVDAACCYKTDFRDDADDATASAFASALGAAAPTLLLELALMDAKDQPVADDV